MKFGRWDNLLERRVGWRRSAPISRAVDRALNLIYLADAISMEIVPGKVRDGVEDAINFVPSSHG